MPNRKYAREIADVADDLGITWEDNPDLMAELEAIVKSGGEPPNWTDLGRTKFLG